MNNSDAIYEHLHLELRRIEEIAVSHVDDSVDSDDPERGLKGVSRLLAELEDQAREMGLVFPIDLLCERFSLTDVERRILLVSLLPSFMPEVLERSGVQQYTGGLFLLYPLTLEMSGFFSEEGALEYRRALSANSKLCRYKLVGLHSDISQSNSDYFIYGYRRIVDFLMGDRRLDRELSTYARLIDPDDVSASDKREGEGHYSGAVTAIDDILLRGRLPFVMLTGPSKAEKDRFVFDYCKQKGMVVLDIDLDRLQRQPPLKELHLLAKDFGRDLRLLNGVLLLRSWNSESGKSTLEMQDRERLIIELVREAHLPIFFASDKEFRFSDESRRVENIETLKIPFGIPDTEKRGDIWRDALNGNLVENSSLDPENLARRYRFTEEQIRMAVDDAKILAGDRRDFSGILTQEDLHRSCRRRMQVNFPGTVKKIETDFQWDDLILSDDHIARLKELAYHLRHSDIVYDDWGFQGKSTAARGIHVLFSGHSGTGKTMAAGVIAKETGLDLYRIDLAGVVNKYIGETEKNLSKIFDEAHNSQAILFFDEADALFGKRSEVKDARDRYANIEVAYLLQKMEEYNGMTILATNLVSNLDEAFKRRLHFMIEFPMPDKATARRLWGRAFPVKAPLGNDIDLDFLSNELQFSGGNIKNVALNAAFFAAEEGTEICMRHVMRSVRREYQKSGRPFGQEDMKKYYDMAIGEIK